ncbi:outer membrane vitamin B12 receptor BtuB [Hydrogenimonas sp.]|nr:outer membrane vitamin B12 receptor BtuB [Hydrogenimonas sp.]
MRFAKGFRGRYFTLAAIAATVSSVQIHAQDTQAVQLHKIVVSAANTEQEEEDVTGDITVITADEIQERGYTTLKEALASVPGISFTSNGGFGQPTSIYLRGLNSDQTLVLVDGVRANDVTGLNGAQFEHFRLDNVERIEVVKGPQSGVWGADASAGVINIITKKSSGKSVAYGFKFGSYNSRDFHLSAGDKIGAFDYSLSLSSFETDGFSAAEPGHSSPLYGTRGDDLGYEEDGYRNRSYTLKTGYDFSRNDRLEASLTAIDAVVHYDSIDFATGKTVDAPDGPFTLNKIRERFYRAAYIRNDGRNSAKLFYNFSTFNRSQYGGYSGHVKEAGITDRFDYTEEGFIQAGGGYQSFYQGLSGGTALSKSYANRYLFATNSNRLFGGKTLLTESLRYDNYTAFDNRLTYKAGLKHSVSDLFAILADYSTGYNVPTLYRLYGSWVGNPDLNPEKSSGFDVGLEYRGFKLIYYSQKVKDLIAYNYSTFKYYNVPGESEFSGVEASYRGVVLDMVSYDLGYTHIIKAKDASGADLARRASDMFSYSLTWFPTDEHTVNLNGYYVGKRYDDAAKTVQTGRYNVTNLSLRHNFAEGYRGEIEIRNIFDRFYQEVDGYATAGRSFYIGISARY